MKDFVRKNPYLSLCGLNCGLCSMHLGGHCPGCGQGVGNQACAIASCSMKQNHPSYCNMCSAYPCDKYTDIDVYDSFITHQHMFKDLALCKTIGEAAYNQIQIQKIEILLELLNEFNDGRRKTFYLTAVNLLSLDEVLDVMKTLRNIGDIAHEEKKEKAKIATALFQKLADDKGINLKLRRKAKLQKG